MMIVWIILAMANTFIAGMHYALIVSNRNDNVPVEMMQYVWVAICLLVAVYLQISIVGRASS